MSDEKRYATLSDKQARGGVIGGKGYGFQAAYIVSRIPLWLDDPDFAQFLQEGAGDVDVRFNRADSEERWYVQVKNYAVRPATVREVFSQFRDTDAGTPGTYTRFTLACPGLSDDLKRLRSAAEELRGARDFFRPGQDPILDNTWADLESLVQELNLPVDVAFLVDKVDFDTNLAGLTDDESLCNLFVGSLLRLDAWARVPPEAAVRAYEKLALLCHQALRQTCSRERLESLIQEAVGLKLSDLCPYQGLAAFTETDAEFFFGRERLVSDLVDHLRGSPRFLAVVGPSGSGKSSVVQAGLFPALCRGEVPGSADWQLLTFRPGDDPFAALSAAGLDVPQESNLEVAVRTFLEAHPQVKRLALFADQFEELFTLCPQPVQERFLRQLAALVESNLSVTIVLTLRADFYGHLLRYRPLVDWLKIGQVNVPPMGPEELRAAVEEPAHRLGLHFEPGLVETIVEEAGTADHPLPLLESAMTQLWERRADGTLTHAAYQSVGQVAGAIGQWAEDAYAELAPEERPLARRVFTRLVRYGEGEVADTPQQQLLSELVTRPEEREPLHRLVRRLADARLLVTGGDPGAETVEIIHDALLQQWGRLKHWTAEQREFYLWRQRLDERLQEWGEKRQDEGALLRGALLVEAARWLTERPEQINEAEQGFIAESLALQEQGRVAREQRRRQFTLAAVGAAVIFLILALLAWGQRNTARDAQATAVGEAHTRATAQAQAEERRLEAESAQAVAEEQRQVALARQLAAQAQIVLDNSSSSVVRSILLAVESLRRYPESEGNQALHRALGLLPRSVAVVEQGGAVRAIAFSPDGRCLATGSDDGTMRVWEANTGHEVARMEHEGPVRAVAFSPDGWWLASASDYPDSTARVWEAVTGKEVARMEHLLGVETVAFSPDGQQVVSVSQDVAIVWEAATGKEVTRKYHGGSGEVGSSTWEATFSPDGHWIVSRTGGSFWGDARVWEADSGKEVSRMRHSDRVQAIALGPNGRWVVSGSFDSTARVWEAASGREISRMTHDSTPVEHDGGVLTVDFSPDGQWVVSGSEDGTARVWEAATGKEVSRMEHEGRVLKAAFSPGGQWVASSSINTVRVWEGATGMEATRIEYLGLVSSVAFSPEGRRVAVGNEDGMARVWDLSAILNLEVPVEEGTDQVGHEGEVLTMAFSPNGQRAVSGSDGGIVRVWEVTTGEDIARMEHEEDVLALAFSPDGQQVVSGSKDRTMRVWETITGKEIARMEHEGDVLAVAFGPDGQQVASGSWDSTATSGSYGGTLRLWDVNTEQEVARMEHEGWVGAVTFSSDGQWLASGGGNRRVGIFSSGGEVRVWEVATGREVTRMEHQDDVLAIAFSPDGRWVASGSESWDHTARVWDAASGREVSRMEHGGAVRVVIFSPNGQWVASGSDDGTVRVWETITGKEVARMEHEGAVVATVFSPDGQWVASASSWPDNLVRVWKADTGQEVARVVHEDGLVDVIFSPDGRWVTSGSRNGTARVWLWRPEDLIAEACAHLSRNLTLEEWGMYLPDERYSPTCPNLPVPED